MHLTLALSSSSSSSSSSFGSTLLPLSLFYSLACLLVHGLLTNIPCVLIYITMANTTGATTATAASGTVGPAEDHPIIIISARGSPNDESNAHALAMHDSPPTSPTMFQHPTLSPHERMLRFDADCVLIPPSTMHKKQHSRSQSLGRRPMLVTKSYSLPVLWKRKSSNEYEGGASPEEAAVFKVSIPRWVS
jgi:hypothetical protein